MDKLDKFDLKIELIEAFAKLINSNFSYDDLIDLIIKNALLVTEGSGSSLLILDQRTNKLHFKSVVGKSSGKLKQFVLNPDEGIAGWIIKSKKAVFVEDVVNDRRWSEKIKQDADLQVHSLAGAPIFVKDWVYGVIEVVYTEPPKSKEKILEALESFSKLVASTIENFVDYGIIKTNYKQLKSSYNEKYRIMGNSNPIKRVISDAMKVSKTNSTILISGESGTGKELVARLIHEKSSRGANNFFAVNCGAIPETMLERELFGHEKGAFTGADTAKIGLFEDANKSTLFLDEIGEMSKQMQVRLLRVIQEGAFTRIGATRETKVDVRILAATNKNLKEEVEKGNFRGDLYYRINVIEIKTPLLKDRGGDISLLAEYFLEKYRKEMNLFHLTIAPDAMLLLQAYDWPGNVRELGNAIERAVVMRNGMEITIDDLPIGPKDKKEMNVTVGMTMKEAQESFKKTLVEQTLDYTGGNKTKAAKILGIERTYLSKLCSSFKANEKKEAENAAKAEENLLP